MTAAPPVTLSRGQFDRIAKALADPTRFALLEAIAAAAGKHPCYELCKDFPVSKATVSHHIKELTRAGLVTGERDGQCMHYRVRHDVLEAYAAELTARLLAKRTS